MLCGHDLIQLFRRRIAKDVYCALPEFLYNPHRAIKEPLQGPAVVVFRFC